MSSTSVLTFMEHSDATNSKTQVGAAAALRKQPASEELKKENSNKLIIKATYEPTEEYLRKVKYSEENQLFLSEKDTRLAVKSIRNTVKNEEARLRKRYTFLQYQDLLGLTIFLTSILTIVGVSALYLKGNLHWALAVPLIALPISILHELEHDLIHNIYFKTHQWVQHVMYFFIYIAKCHALPWYRKYVHLRHHVTSGSKRDFEERAIGGGLQFGVLRYLLTTSPWAVFLAITDVKRDNPEDFSVIMALLTNAPSLISFTVLWLVFTAYLFMFGGFTFLSTYLPMWAWPMVRDLSVIIVLPNLVRQTCLNLMASYCHYYGDVPEGDVFYQGQVIDHWTMIPFQLFSFNFGSSHIIHHFVPNQPFYIREAISRKANAEMIKQGVRNNDWGIVARANRFHEKSKHLPEADKTQVIPADQWVNLKY